MKITILTLTYPPEPADQIHELATYLRRNDLDITIITCLPSYPKGKIYKNYRRKLYTVELIDDIKIIRVPVFPSQSYNIFHRSLYYLTYGISSVLPVLLTKTDIFIAYQPPPTSILPILFKSIFEKTKFIYWINDMWPETLTVRRLPKIPLLIYSYLQNIIYKKASKIIVLSDGFKSNLISKYVNRYKICIIHNWVQVAKYSQVINNECMFDKYMIKKDLFTITYAGSQGVMQQLEVIINSIDYLDVQKIQFIFLGIGTEHKKLKQLAKSKKNSDKILFLGRVSKSDMFSLYNISDAMIIHLRDLEINTVTIPHKIYGYMASGKPIVAGLKGDAAYEIELSKTGYIFKVGDSVDLSNKIKKLLKLKYNDRRNMGLNGLNFVKKNRSITSQGSKFLKVLTEIQKI